MKRSCPRRGQRVRFEPNKAAAMMYDRSSPAAGSEGEITTIPVPGGRSTCLPGPRGGMVYVKWDNGRVEGVFAKDLVPPKKKGK